MIKQHYLPVVSKRSGCVDPVKPSVVRSKLIVVENSFVVLFADMLLDGCCVIKSVAKVVDVDDGSVARSPAAMDDSCSVVRSADEGGGGPSVCTSVFIIVDTRSLCTDISVEIRVISVPFTDGDRDVGEPLLLLEDFVTSSCVSVVFVVISSIVDSLLASVFKFITVVLLASPEPDWEASNVVPTVVDKPVCGARESVVVLYELTSVVTTL